MICYLDSSALVKRYVSEPGSDQVLQAFATAEAVGTAVISCAEVSAALAKAARFGLLTLEQALSAYKVFRGEWVDFIRLQLTEFSIERAADLAWEHGLRGFDSVQLAAAATWQEALDAPVNLMTFDRQLWTAAKAVGLEPYPEDLPLLLESWSSGRA